MGQSVSVICHTSDCPGGQSKLFFDLAGEELKSRPLAASWGALAAQEHELGFQSRCEHITVPEAHGALECTTHPFLGLQSQDVHCIPFQVSCSIPTPHCSSLSLLSGTCDIPNPFLPKSTRHVILSAWDLSFLTCF